MTFMKFSFQQCAWVSLAWKIQRGASRELSGEAGAQSRRFYDYRLEESAEPRILAASFGVIRPYMMKSRGVFGLDLIR
jgi:hypothetical protein